MLRTPPEHLVPRRFLVYAVAPDRSGPEVLAWGMARTEDAVVVNAADGAIGRLDAAHLRCGYSPNLPDARLVWTDDDPAADPDRDEAAPGTDTAAA